MMGQHFSSIGWKLDDRIVDDAAPHTAITFFQQFREQPVFGFVLTTT